MPFSVARPWWALVPVLIAAGAMAAAEDIETPVSNDPELEMVLVADSRQIVQPISIDIDHDGRLLAIESHTHFPPEGYDQGKVDRVLALTDEDDDGSLESVQVFFADAKHCMDICVHFDGSVYLATRNEIMRLRDLDGDGVADDRQRIVFLDTKGSYPHNGLSGLRFDFDGNLYFGMGENLGAAYELQGSDGTVIADEAEGGNVFWCRADGSQLRRVATGFWNPFGVCRDVFGNLFAIDNDPSANGCRLLHVIEGGNYGYHYRYGRSGLHPFIAWRGELPGTLPMVCPTGEAPCELISYEAGGLPAKYSHTLLSACWSEHQIQQYVLQPRGASFQAQRKAIVQGGPDFRPVGIAVDRDGSLLISDWVKRDYKLHGHGRIWRLRRKSNRIPAINVNTNRAARETVARKLLAQGKSADIASWLQRTGKNAVATDAVAATALEASGAKGADSTLFQAAIDSQWERLSPKLQAQSIRRRQHPAAGRPGMSNQQVAELAGGAETHPHVRLAAVGALRKPEHWEALMTFLADADPFLRSAAIHQLAHSSALLPKTWQNAARQPSAEVRTQLLLAQRRGGVDPQAILPDALQDPSEQVRFMALKWIADQQLTAFESDVQALLDASDTPTRLFLAAATALARIRGQSADEGKILAQLLPKLDDSQAAPAAKVMILRGIPGRGELRRANKIQVKDATLQRLLQSESRDLRREALRFLSAGASRQQAELAFAIARDAAEDLAVRRDAMLVVAQHADAFRDELLSMGMENDGALQREALQAMAGESLDASQRDRLQEYLAQLNPQRAGERFQLAQRVLNMPLRKKERNVELGYWLNRVGAGDREAGRRVFLHAKLAKCSSCHQREGRGSMIGPDLSQLASQSDARKILTSIVDPNEDVAPHYAAWRILTDDGKVRTAFLVSQTEQDQTFVDDQAQMLTLKNEEIEAAEPLPTSIMPTGLLALLTDREVRDLLAYLESP